MKVLKLLRDREEWRLYVWIKRKRVYNWTNTWKRFMTICIWVSANFCGEYLIHIRKYYLKDGCLKPKTEGCVFTVNQFAIFREILHDLEERSWALEEGMPVVEYDNFVGPWRVTVDVFANVLYTQILFQRWQGTTRRCDKGHFVSGLVYSNRSFEK